ncbi:MAG: DNA internalization-related competence protein ComEC/Rec2 [Candidatus Omnitrophota bacterium]|nr:DNA internalization-related competence protein ComEC/Rec2 [Candidatus Omnitrophota bacterium]
MAAIIFFRHRTISYAALFIAIVFTGSALFINSNILPANHILNFLPPDERSDIFIKGVVADDPVSAATMYKTIRTSFTLKAEEIGKMGTAPYFPERAVENRALSPFLKVSGLVKVDIFSESYRPIYFGNEVILEGAISRPHGLNNPGLFNYAEYLKLKNIYCCLRVGKGGVMQVFNRDSAASIKSAAYKIRRKMLALIDEYLQAPYGGFLKAILIGDRTELKDRVQDDFIKTGTVHVIAVSGLQVALIAAVFLAIFRIFGVPKKANLAITTVLLILYAIIAGANPPIIRSVIMFAVCGLGYMIGRDTDALNSLSIAALAILIWNPKTLYDPSFQLSFASIAGTLLFTQKLNAVFPGVIFKKNSWPGWAKAYRYVTTGVSVSVAAWLGSFPIVASYFNIFSPVSVAANLIVIPILFVLMTTSFLFLAAASVSTYLAAGLARCLELTEKILFLINGFFANIPFAFFRIGKPSPAVTFLYYALLILLIAPAGLIFKRIRINRMRGAIAALVLLNILVWPPLIRYGAQVFKMTVLDVGQGDSVFAEFPIRGNMLIDGGPGGEEDSSDMGESVVAPFLWNRGVDTIDIVAPTHFHEDHLGGLLYVLKNFKVGCVIDSGAIGVENGKIYGEYLKIIKEKNIRRISVGEGDMIRAFNDTRIFILNPPVEKTLQDSNDNSIVMKIVCGKHSFLFCADIKDRAMSRLLTYEDFLRSDVLKIPHHAGALGNSRVVADFFDFVSPAISLISVGAANKYGMPSGRTMDIITDLRANIYMTKYSGAIEIYADPKSDMLRAQTSNKN